MNTTVTSNKHRINKNTQKFHPKLALFTLYYSFIHYNIYFVSTLSWYKTNLNRQKRKKIYTKRKKYIIYKYIYKFHIFFYNLLRHYDNRTFLTWQVHNETSRHPITHPCLSDYVCVKTLQRFHCTYIEKKITVSTKSTWSSFTWRCNSNREYHCNYIKYKRIFKH